MHKIIFINRFFYPDKSATSQILTDLLFNISDRLGIEVHVIASRNTYLNDEVLPRNEIINGVNIHRASVTRFGRGNLMGRAFDYLSFYFSAFLLAMRLVKKHDLVVVKTDPPVISFVVYLVAKIKRARFINWIQDLFPEVASGLGMMSESSLHYKLLKRIKNISLSAAETNVVIGNKMRDRLLREGIDESRITVIDNWSIAESTEYINNADNYLVSEWGLEDKFIIEYSGNFGRAHEYDVMCKLLDHYQHDVKVVFLFIGGGKYYDDIQLFVDKSAISNVIFKPYQDKSVLNYSLSLADLHIISLRNELEGLIVPSKFYGLASIGAPVLFLGDVDGEIASMLKKDNSGYCFPPDDFSDISQLIDDLASGVKNTETVRANLLEAYKSNYKPEKAYSKWLQVIESIK